ncbi:uncharacterized protein V1518DRAFT_416016 [Limtongia smithiae]|uniref:uncharacterized protein n=1 Tax=Limtongia smithiae TaxID=1125753 RepID=UPI0034CFE9F3
MTSDMILLVDFDETITVEDTLHLVADAAYQAHANDDAASDDAIPSWSHFSETYMADYTAFAASYNVALAQRTTIAAELAYLAALDSVEEASVRRVEQSRLFRGVTSADLTTQALRVRLQPGVGAVLRRCREEMHMRIGVVSVNWSGLFIHEVLRLNGICSDDDEDDGLQIFCNDIDLDTAGRGTGLLTTGSFCMRTGAHKAELLAAIRASPFTASREDIATQLANSRLHGTLNTGTDDISITRRPKIIYIGDSTGDLAPLLKADVGVILGDKKSLRDTCARIGIDIRTLDTRGVEGDRRLVSNRRSSSSLHDGAADDAVRSRVLYSISSWHDIPSSGYFGRSSGAF